MTGLTTYFKFLYTRPTFLDFVFVIKNGTSHQLSAKR